MAKPNWLTVNPTSGTGNSTVTVTAEAHTGRESRSGVITFKADNCEDVERKVTQAGIAEFVKIDDNASVDKAGGSVNITGTSNSSALAFSLGDGDLNISLPDTYTANGATTENEADIADDPGADATFSYSIAITVPANDTISALTRNVIVTDAAGNTATCVLTLAAGSATLSVTEGDIELDSDGTAVTVDVTSNTNWTVE